MARVITLTTLALREPAGPLAGASSSPHTRHRSRARGLAYYYSKYTFKSSILATHSRTLRYEPAIVLLVKRSMANIRKRRFHFQILEMSWELVKLSDGIVTTSSFLGVEYLEDRSAMRKENATWIS
jgi:hypothetical protein